MELFNRNSARRFLRTGELPKTFSDNVEMFLEFEQCVNCGGRECISCVLQYQHDKCKADCPLCTERLDCTVHSWFTIFYSELKECYYCGRTK